MFSVRKATLGDTESIMKITQQAFKKYIEVAGITDTAALHETKEQVEYDILNKNVYVAYIDDVVVGSVRMEQINEHTAYLSRFGVSDEYQNLGIGKSIMAVFNFSAKGSAPSLRFTDILSQRIRTAFSASSLPCTKAVSS